jgi:hypothetical protein
MAALTEKDLFTDSGKKKDCLSPKVSAFHYLAIFTMACLSLLLNATSSFAQSSENWDALVGGVRKLTSDTRIREEFALLCKLNKTAIVNGKMDTGGGLYMPIDVPVYEQPNNFKRYELKDASVVVLAGETRQAGEKEWVKIKYLHVSSHTEMAVGIEDGWVKQSDLIYHQK